MHQEKYVERKLLPTKSCKAYSFAKQIQDLLSLMEMKRDIKKIRCKSTMCMEMERSPMDIENIE